MENVIYATLREESSDVVYTKRSHQYNRGVKLCVSGVALPEKYQVHFSNNESKGVTAALWVSGNDIPIPDAYFETGDYIHIWIYFVQEGKSSPGMSMYRVIIPIEKRPAILDVIDSSGGTVINANLDEETHTLVFHD